MADDILLAIDQGTSSTRAIGFSAAGDVAAVEQQSFEQIYPGPGWVEHDAEVIWATVLSTARRVLQLLREAKRGAAAIGITNQRETTILWDRRSGAPIYNAIVWQDRRTADRCRQLAADHGEADISRKTGLRFDPYFSATKIAWILDRVPGAREAAKAGHIAFGTVDSFLIWRLTGGRLHLTDATNASRTALYDIGKGRWDEALCEIFTVPMSVLPEVRDSAGDFGHSDPGVLGQSLPIRGVAGDQQAALIGQACFAAGDVKIRRPAIAESTAFGAASLAGLGCGVYGSLQELAALRRTETRFEPASSAPDREIQIAGWREALRRVRSA